MKINTRLCALISLYGHIIFLAVLIFEHFLRTELPPLSHYLSEYSLGPYGYIHITAFVLLAVIQVFLFAGLHSKLKTSVFTLITVGLFIICLLFLVIFPGDKPGLPGTTTGAIHNMSALFGFAIFKVAMILWGFTFLKNSHWRKTGFITFLFCITAFILFTAGFFINPAYAGLLQRANVLCDISWLLFITYKLLKQSN
jgi:Protein of unknown function (DUF998)